MSTLQESLRPKEQHKTTSLPLSKRNNPKTGKPFKKGQWDESGTRRFWSYNKNQTSGRYFYENWVSPEKFDSFMKSRNNYMTGETRTLTGIATKQFHAAKARALANDGVCSITKEWIFDKLSKGVCELTGKPFVFIAKGGVGRSHPFGPSLDRIDNSNRDYSPGNTRLVFNMVNKALSNFTEMVSGDELADVFEAMAVALRSNKK